MFKTSAFIPPISPFAVSFIVFGIYALVSMALSKRATVATIVVIFLAVPVFFEGKTVVAFVIDHDTLRSHWMETMVDRLAFDEAA